ncbi:MAG: fasciclin domain-containing protein [Acidobacteriota bacterium]
MTRMATRVLVLLLATALLSTVAYAGDHDKKDIVDTAVAAGTFETLVTAVKAAGLVDTLKGEGPFTVFAPSDEAFAKLPEGTIEALLADTDKLTAVLTYHVVAGKKMASDVVAAKSLTTVQGSDLTVSTEGGAKINNANIVATDIETSNGVIHVIDTVVLPN